MGYYKWHKRGILQITNKQTKKIALFQFYYNPGYVEGMWIPEDSVVKFSKKLY